MWHTYALFSIASVATLTFTGVVVASAGAVCHLMAGEGERREAEICGKGLDELYLKKMFLKSHWMSCI